MPACAQAPRQDARAVVDVILVAPAAIDVNAGKRFQVARVALHQVDRIVREPALPALLDALAGLEIARQAKAERRLRVRVVSGRHAQVHDAVDFGRRKLSLCSRRALEIA